MAYNHAQSIIIHDTLMYRSFFVPHFSPPSHGKKINGLRVNYASIVLPPFVIPVVSQSVPENQWRHWPDTKESGIICCIKFRTADF